MLCLEGSKGEARPRGCFRGRTGVFSPQRNLETRQQKRKAAVCFAGRTFFPSFSHPVLWRCGGARYAKLEAGGVVKLLAGAQGGGWKSRMVGRVRIVLGFQCNGIRLAVRVA